MPTKRTRRTRNRLTDLSPYQVAWLLDQELPEPSDADRWWRLMSEDDTGEQSLWLANEQQFIEWWLADNPGRRPACWWKYSAPRQAAGRWPGAWFDGALPEPRRRLGGIGDPAFKHLNVVPRYTYGIPASWLDGWWEDRLRHSRPGFAGRAIDLKNPPTFESQAGFLWRQKLLVPGERERLSDADFEPEEVCSQTACKQPASTI